VTGPAPLLHHVALRVADCERSAEFYGGLLRLPEVRRYVRGGDLRSVWLRLGEVVLMLERDLRGAGPAAGSGHVLVLTGDPTSWEPRLREAGVEVTDRTGSTLYFQDPDGHRLGVSDYRLGEALEPT
jgi:catechol 2,3-dioxygenase-like lactoylglutathione lyase family enzyme